VRLSEDIKSLDSSTKPLHVPQRRDGDGRLAREVDDIISLVTLLDEQKLINSVPRYVASSPDRMPSLRLYEGDLSGMMNVLHDMGNRHSWTSDRVTFVGAVPQAVRYKQDCQLSA